MLLDQRRHFQQKIATLITGQRTPGWKCNARGLNRAIDISPGCQTEFASGAAVRRVHVALNAPRALLKHPLTDDDRVARNEGDVGTSEAHADPLMRMSTTITRLYYGAALDLSDFLRDHPVFIGVLLPAQR